MRQWARLGFCPLVVALCALAACEDKGSSEGAGGAAGSAGETSVATGGAATGGAASAGAGGGGEPTNDAWIGSWAVAPQGCGEDLGGKTLRQVVHTSIAGTQVRLSLSNAFGSQAIEVTHVTLAAPASGSSVVAESSHPVTFAGADSVTLGVGELAVSDAVDFTVEALSDVAVSFYVPNSTGGATCHQLGLQTNYWASGNVAADSELPSPATMGSYYLLSGLDVKNPGALGSLVTLGASITDGVSSPGDANHRWPNRLAERLDRAGLTVGVLNQGISGNKLLQDGAGQSALHRFARDVLAQPDARWVIFSDDPINDLGAGAGAPSGDELLVGLGQLIDEAHDAGLSFLCSTLTPFEGSGGWSPSAETARAQINDFVRSSESGCGAVVDQDVATHDPAEPTRFLPAYDAGDHLHPNEAGLQAIADAVDLALFEP